MPRFRVWDRYRFVIVDWFTDNWPLVLAGLAAVMLVTGIVKKIAKMAFILVCLAVIVLGLVTQVSF